VAFNNLDKIFREARRWIAKDGLESYVLNMGNLSDSLAFENRRPFIAPFVELFRKEAEAKGRPHCALLVTKGGTAECAMLFKIKPCANMIISFSVNHSVAAKRFEAGAAPTADRFRAATRLKKLGWRVRIRIDPMIRGYDYSDVLRQTRALRPERVTLGMLRAEHNLPRHAPKGLFGELVPPALKKDLARYPLPLRLTYYRKAIRTLKDICPIALCEEPASVWDALGLDTAGRRCNCNT
jgi:DNA repair photolyase